MAISHFFLFLVFVAGLGEAQNECEELIRCGGGGPAIRFPFRLINRHQDYCGCAGFNLSCTDANDTVLELPNFVKFIVKKIDYKSQVIEVYDPNHCFPKQLGGLDFSSTPFLPNQQYQYEFAFFNCPSTETRSYNTISCLSGPSHEVRAFLSESDINDLPIASCEKMYTLPSISSGLIFGYDKILQLKWSRPNCTHCVKD